MVQKDRKMIQELIKVDKEHPEEFLTFFTERDHEKKIEDLGFGWSTWSVWEKAGYIHVHGEFFFFEDSLISFIVAPEMMDEGNLFVRYKKWYDNYFEFTEDSLIIPYAINYNMLFEPLEEYTDTLKIQDIPSNILPLMKPLPNQSYHYKGGSSASKPSYRKIFEKYSDSLSFDDLIFMSYSKNPVTRFLILEEMLRREGANTRYDGINKDWFEACLREVPKIETLRGCFGSQQDSQWLVYMYAHNVH